MTTLFTQTAVALLARERLLELRTLMRARQAAAAAGAFTSFEQKLLFLAEQSLVLTDVAPRPPAEALPKVLHNTDAATVSQFFIMGSAGTSLPRYLTVVGQGQPWLSDTLRTGGIDAQRSLVAPNTFKVPFETFRRVSARIATSARTREKKAEALGRVQAWMLGWMCHLAGSALTAPLLEEVAGHDKGEGVDKRYTRFEVGARMDEAVREALWSANVKEDKRNWQSWWPEPGEVPEELFPALSEAINDAYFNPSRRLGTPEFEVGFTNSGTVTTVDGPALAASYRAFRYLEGDNWSRWKWFGLLSPAVIPLLLSVPLFTQLPEGKKVHKDTLTEVEKGWYQVFGLQYAATALGPPIVSFIAAGTGVAGFSGEVVAGLLLAIPALTGAVLFFASLGSEVAPGVRWTFLLVPLVAELVYAIVMLVRSKGDVLDRGRRLLAWGFLLHVGVTLLGLLFVAIPFIADALRDTDDWWWILAILLVLSGILFVTLYLIGLGLEKAFGLSGAVEGIPIGKPHYLRLFDDSSLTWPLPVPPPVPPGVSPAPPLTERLYPSDRRPLLKLWWTGAATVKFLPRGNRLEFTGNGKTIHFLAPLAPTSLGDLMGQLQRSVVGVGGAGETLGVVLAFDGDGTEVLPPGGVFADLGEADLTLSPALRLAAATAPVNLPTQQAQALVVHHARREKLGVRFGVEGPALPLDDRVAASTAGVGTITADPNGSETVVQGTGTSFLTFFRPGDLLRVAGSPDRVIASVRTDTDLSLVASMPALPASNLPGVAFQRVLVDRLHDSDDLPGTLSVHANGPAPNLMKAEGAGVDVAALLMPGDLVEARMVPQGREKAKAPEVRKVAYVASNLSFVTEEGFSSSMQGAKWRRLGAEARDGWTFMASPASNLRGGTSVMDAAADLAALLCLSATSHLLPPEARAVGAPGYAAPDPLKKVYRVFRHWNLDHRRVNEWRMLVTGGALDEDPRLAGGAADPVMLAPDEALEPGAVAAPGVAGGAEVAFKVGWVPLLREWARRHTDTAQGVASASRPHAADPSNQELSRGLAYLLGMVAP